MKKYILSLLVVAFISSSSFAQAFKKGDVMISPGIGLGLYGVGYGIGFALPVVLNADFGVHDYVSVGAYGGFWTRSWNYNLLDESYRFTSTHFGMRATFHWWQLLDKHVNADLLSDKLDIYFTPWIGYNIRNSRWTGSGNNTESIVWGNRVQGGSQIGVRYFISNKVAFFAEWGGTPTAWSNWGLTFKF